VQFAKLSLIIQAKIVLSRFFMRFGNQLGGFVHMAGEPVEKMRGELGKTTCRIMGATGQTTSFQ
jgi:hypothetical protein